MGSGTLRKTLGSPSKVRLPAFSFVLTLVSLLPALCFGSLRVGNPRLTAKLPGISLLKQAQQVVASLKAKQFEQAGTQFAQLAQAIPDSKNPSLHTFIAFAKKVGVDITSAEKCLNDLKSGWGSIVAFKKDMAMDAKRFRMAIDDLGAAAGTFVQAARDCGGDTPLVQKLLAKSNALSHGVSIVSKGLNVVIEGSQLIDQVAAAADACKAEQFEQCGSAVGALLLKVPDSKVCLDAHSAVRGTKCDPCRTRAFTCWCPSCTSSVANSARSAPASTTA